MSLGPRGGLPGQGAFARQATAGVTFTPSRYYYGGDGRVYCDIAPQPGYPTPLIGVPVYTSAGDPSRFVQAGRRVQTDPNDPESMPQVLVLFVGAESSPVAIAERSAKGANTTLALDSHGTVNGGTHWEHAASGNMTAALGESGTLTVSRDGDASGRLVLRDELVGYLQALTTQLDIMLARLAVCETLIPVPPPIPNVTFPDPADYTLGAAVLPVASDAE